MASTFYKTNEFLVAVAEGDPKVAKTLDVVEALEALADGLTHLFGHLTGRPGRNISSKTTMPL